MDIREAKEEIRSTITSYFAKEESGQHCIPILHQRPILLMGPPGIGKTAILAQLAGEMELGLVAYTMTHHTRQSALGLPLIREHSFGGKSYQATEYTMSEIVASVYETIEHSGNPRGILFLDEINCVSETLLPAMLQLLQQKQFGVHRLPEDWVIVAAGNPPIYNQSARPFDAVTLDRVKLLEVSDSFPVWLEYASAQAVHPAILSYLTLKPEHFFSVEPRAGGRSFVTARGWEDLSLQITAYEKLGIHVKDSLFGAYLQHQEIAASFCAYYRLYQSCCKRLPLQDVLSGAYAGGVSKLREMRFDARLAILEFLLHGLKSQIIEWEKHAHSAESFQNFISALPEGAAYWTTAQDRLTQRVRALAVRLESGAIGREAAEREKIFLDAMLLRFSADPYAGNAMRPAMMEEARGLGEQTEKLGRAVHGKLENAIRFIWDTFGEEQELLIFITQLSSFPGVEMLFRRYGNTLWEEIRKKIIPEGAVFH